MSSIFTQVLELEIVLRGVERVERYFHGLASEIGASHEAVQQLTLGFAFLGAAAVVATEGLEHAMMHETMIANMDAFTGSSERAAQQLEMIQEIASRGIFNEKDIYASVRIMDAAGISLRENIDLVEKLGARSGSIVQAAEL